MVVQVSAMDSAAANATLIYIKAWSSHQL